MSHPKPSPGGGAPFTLPSPASLASLASELDSLAAQARASLGPQDARYIRRLLWTIRGCETAGRALLLAGSASPPAAAGGALLLGLSKVLENMEFGHNVMHGQYDWMHDPRFAGKTYDWDNDCTAADWRDFHNFQHHHHTNVVGVDRDFGYGMLRLSADVPWERRFLFQLPHALLVATYFQLAIAIHNLELDRLRTHREATLERIRRLWPRARAKIARQTRRDYLWWPLLGAAAGLAIGVAGAPAGLPAAAELLAAAGRGALAVAAGNLVANVIRNVWSFVVIFCGHFTDQVHTFQPQDLAGETRGQWYLRQILGSANIGGGRLFHLLTGNLSHQIEHHLFPDLPARRYAELAPRVREICARHGLPYNTGSLWRQFGSVLWRMARYSLPGRGQQAVALRQQPE